MWKPEKVAVIEVESTIVVIRGWREWGERTEKGW
jgi:hypothetical protein